MTVAEIDAELVQARWRWLHGMWANDAAQTKRAETDLDTLLGQRRELTNPTPNAAADRG